MRKTEENEVTETINMQKNEKIEKQNKNNKKPETLATVYTHTQVF